MAQGWYEEKLRKVRKYDAADWSENEGHRVAGDYASGRKVFPCYGDSAQAKRYAEWRDDPKNRLSALEQAFLADCRRLGIDVPTEHKKPECKRRADAFKSAVYLTNGCRLLFNTADEALERLCCDEHAVKMWDGTARMYLTK